MDHPAEQHSGVLNFPALCAELGMPTGPKVVGCLTIENLGALDHRLKGCWWELVVRVVFSPPAERSWPSLEPLVKGPSGFAFQIWRLRVFHLTSCVYGDIHWHPERGVFLNLGGLEGEGSLSQTAINQARRRLLATMKQLPRLGRPCGGGARFQNAHEFRETVVGDLRALRAKGRDQTQLELARLWYQTDANPTAEVDSLVSEIKRFCREFGIPWSVLKAEVRRA